MSGPLTAEAIDRYKASLPDHERRHLDQGCEACGRQVVVTVRFEQVDGVEGHRHLCPLHADRFRVRGWAGPQLDALDVDGGFRHDVHGDTNAPDPAPALREALEQARLVAQWHDAVDHMPDVLRGELRDLGIAVALATPTPAAPPATEGGSDG